MKELVFAIVEMTLLAAPWLLLGLLVAGLVRGLVPRARIRQWLKTLRKKNVSVIFATQSLADIKDSSIAPAIIENLEHKVTMRGHYGRQLRNAALATL